MVALIEANGGRSMGTVDWSTDPGTEPPGFPRTRARAADLLPRLISAEAEHDLPVVEWRLDHQGRLLGEIRDGGVEAARSWADFFGTTVHELPDITNTAGNGQVATGLDDYRGVTVVVKSRT
jgi:hypothetical protein